jgi:hypothetical protein
MCGQPSTNIRRSSPPILNCGSAVGEELDGLGGTGATLERDVEGTTTAARVPNVAPPGQCLIDGRGAIVELGRRFRAARQYFDFKAALK